LKLHSFHVFFLKAFLFFFSLRRLFFTGIHGHWLSFCDVHFLGMFCKRNHQFYISRWSIIASNIIACQIKRTLPLIFGTHQTGLIFAGLPVLDSIKLQQKTFFFLKKQSCLKDVRKKSWSEVSRMNLFDLGSRSWAE
jgi:hypothetical protein